MYEATVDLYQADNLTNNAATGEAESSQEDDKHWGEALTALVAANAGVIVKCPWLGGAEVTLGEAMTTFNWPPNLTAADEPYLISVVERLLANRVEQTEEPEVEEEPEPEDESKPRKTEEKTTPDSTKNEKDDQPNIPKVQLQTESKGLDKAETKRPPNEVSAKDRPVAPATKNVEDSTQPIASSAPAVQTQPTSKSLQNHSESQTGIAKQPIAPSPSNNSPHINEGIPNQPQVVVGAGATHENYQPEPIIAPVELGANRSEPILVQPPESAFLGAAVEEPIEFEPIKPIIIDVENVAVSYDSEELTGEIEVTDNELQTFESEIGLDVSTASAEGEVLLLEHAGGTAVKPDEFYPPVFEEIEDEELEIEPVVQEATTAPVAEANQPVQLEAAAPQLTSITLIAENLEDALVQLSEHLQASQPPTIELLSQTLDQVSETAAKLEIGSPEDLAARAEIQEELQELFMELFENSGLDYTPEIIESLTRLTTRQYLADEISKPRKIEQAPTSGGTHEIINKLLLGLSDIQRTVAQSYALGRSALTLCRFYLAGAA